MNDIVSQPVEGAGSVTLHDLKPRLADVREEVLEGLSDRPRHISPKYFYDERGSELFARITQLPECYPTTAEIEILENRLEAIAARIGSGHQLVEYGSGNSHKIRVLLQGLRPRLYMPVDISRDHLMESATAIAAEYSWLQVHAVCADYSIELELPFRLPDVPLAAFFPGSSIGNFERADAGRFLGRVHHTLGIDGRLLIGVDRRKPAALIEPAYNDSEGVTEAFNRNALVHLNATLGGTIDPEGFEHEARYDEQEGCLRMHLVSRRDQQFTLAGEQFEFARGERIHTENSYKYAPEEFRSLAAEAGFDVLEEWTDAQALFSVFALQAA